MPITTIIKPDVLDDPDPNAVAPDPSRVFPVALMSLNGQSANRQIFKSRAVTGTPAADAKSAQTAIFDATLYVTDGSAWFLAGDAVPALLSNRLASAMIGGFPQATLLGFLQLTNISASGDATGFVQTLYEADETSDVPRNSRGFPEVETPGLRSWSGLTNFTPPDGATPPARIVSDVQVAQRYVLLQSDHGNGAGFIEILSESTPLGSGIQLAAGDSIELPVQNLRDIWAHADTAGLILRIAKF
jgi:hypothetical protein